MSRDGFVGFTICNKETDLYILAKNDLASLANKHVCSIRSQLEAYIVNHREFLTSLLPVEVDDLAPAVAKKMAEAAKLCNVGPMAAVAGAISEFVGTKLLMHSNEIIVENGGDIFASIKGDMTIGVYAKENYFPDLKIKIFASNMPMGICTSSGMFGHSFSFGKADAAVVLSENTALADAAATRFCNEIKTKNDINKTIELSQSIAGLEGVLLIKDDVLGVWGNITLI